MKILEDKGYLNKKHLCTGGEGEVYLVKLEEKEYIAKIFPLLADESIDVLKTIQRLSIKGIPKIHEIFNYEDKTIVIRDYIEGTTLYDEIRKNEYLSLKRAKNIILNICETLKQLHNAKPNPIIYRDLKPENIIVSPLGDIHLIDFGIARYYKKEQTRDTVLAGTKGYTAPEVMAGIQSDNRSDIYSAGLLFYEMITGKSILSPPFQIRPVKESNEYLPEWLDIVIKKATDINQTNRYKLIDDFMDAIENPVIPKKKTAKKVYIKAALIALAGLAAIGAIYAALKLGIFDNHSDAAPPALNNIPTSAIDEKYTVLIHLDFDSEEDKSWIMGFDENSHVELADSQLIVPSSYNIDYIMKPGMFVHFKVIQPKYGFVSAGAYRINAPVNFEAIYHNDHENRDYTSRTIYLDGAPFKNNGQVVDAIIYITEDCSVVYAIAIDDQNKKICYLSYRVPDSLKDIPLYIEIGNFTGGAENVLVDSIIVASGSLRMYLDDNFKSYAEYKSIVDAFLSKDTDSLEEIIIKPADEWN
ncbi:MAG: serine/threonine protein kinase [Clostridia bacterium]|nr:serine/threonine protein kinase [Clostridia bacterium]